MEATMNPEATEATMNPIAQYGKASIRAGLLRARNLLANNGWTTNAFCRDKNDHIATDSEFDGTPVKWCLDGAISRAAADLNMPAFVLREPVQRKLDSQYPTLSMWAFNDTSPSVDRILKLLDDTIADYKEA
jgi:hypothetical protein